MPISIPKFFQRAFAQNGGKQDVPITGDNSGGRASYDVGFPPVTRVPIVAGGIPPFGTDFNGVLYDMSAAIQYVQSGVAFPFNQDFATAIGGYEVGAIVSDVSNKSLLWINGTASNTAFPTGWTQFSLDQASESIRGTLRVGTQIEVDSSALDNVVVTPKKLRAGFSVSLNANGYITFPSWLGGLIIQWAQATQPTFTNVTTFSVNFPITFPNATLNVTPSGSASGAILSASSSTTSAVTLTALTRDANGSHSSGAFSYIAIGY